VKVVLSVDPIKFPLTGIGRYTYELACGLLRADLNSLQFLQGSRLQSGIPTCTEAQPMSGVPPWKKYALKSPLAVGLYKVLNPWQKGRALRGFEDHIFHSPNYYLPPFEGKSVVTMHDLSAFLLPQSHPPERVRYMQSEVQISLKRAAALITDTEYTRQEVAKFFSWPLERIFAIPLASSAAFRPHSETELTPVLQSLGLEAFGYTLFAGTVEPRKNLGVLLDAYSSLPARLRMRFPLVIAGYRGWGSHDLHLRIEAYQREGWLRYLGFVPQRQLPALMAGARLFVYPSLYEGFGLPVVEAMACGVPVICSNASTLPEVAGDAAAFHAPEDADTLIELLKTGMEDQAWRDSARLAGLAKAASYSWDRCTRQTITVYESLLNSNTKSQ